MTTTQTPAIASYEDHEGDGTCQSCGREGLRWIVRLSDGSGVGTECAKSVLGWKPATKDYNWIADYTAIAETVEYGETLVLWQHRTKNVTRETRNGRLTQVGGARKAWTEEGRI